MSKLAAQIRTVTCRLSLPFIRDHNLPLAGRPPPYDDDRHHRFSRLLSVGSLTLLLLLSVPALVLKAFSYSFIESNAEMGFYLVNHEVQREPGENYLVAALPHNLFRVPEKLVLVVAMLNILLSAAHLAFLAWDWKACRRTYTRAFRRNAMVLHIINTILISAALIAMFVTHKRSALFKDDLIPKTPNAVTPSGFGYYRYDAGKFDLETWTCELENAQAVGEARKDYRAQCDIEVAGRMVLVPFFLTALMIAGLSVWTLVVGGKQGPRTVHLYTKDADLEVGQGTKAGGQVSVEEVELATLERQARQKDGRLSKIEEDSEDTEESPRVPAATASMDAKKGTDAS